MEHSITEQDGVSIVALSGDVDLESSPIAREVLLAAVDKKMPVLADLAEVNYIDSSGIASLVETLQAAKSTGKGFGLVQVSESALRVLELARLDKVFTIYGTIDDGIKGES
ncbi:MAG: STAS domain-containing protein [Rhodospirillaceae bacterium]|jgi:anti-sigma B factor antagonist|nr:STAS domain-containing protein [Rhodospirillaceae bacterium]MBT4588897.1 STAS domain-containing protein [Rhodospirillaceae bacterium]MBT4941171.1 STAS domain-containing protein [Rhodospirillaceae bacterium]MBT5941300.1 STAS domain-containing protein [Rhodospirillaceae bacterium]MBT7268619.1 STAS domain-containing protein [Rhodospirillaceae bacterium]